MMTITMIMMTTMMIHDDNNNGLNKYALSVQEICEKRAFSLS